MNNVFQYGIEQLTVGKTILLASGQCKGILNDEAVQKIKLSQECVHQIDKQ